MSIEDVSDRLKTSSRGMELLLNALVAMDMPAGAGAHDIQRLAIQTPNDSGIITATV